MNSIFIEKNYRSILLLIPLLSLVMHWHVFSLDLVGVHVWRQTQTQTVVNNFYSGDNNILNPKYNNDAHTDRIMRMEFPLMQWIFAQACRIIGPPVFVSRMLSFLIGLCSVFGMFALLLRIFRSKPIAAIGAWCFNFSPVFYYYTLNPLPDNLALCAGIWSIALFFQWLESKRFLFLALGGLLLMLSTLAKLPFILYLSVPGVYTLILLAKQERDARGKWLSIVIVYLLALAPAISWYVWVIPTWTGNGIVKGMLDSSESIWNILDILQHHLISTLPELLVNYAAFPLFVAGLYFLFKNKTWRHRFFPMLLCWLLAVMAYFLFEINMIGKVHDYYLFPFLPILFIAVAYGARCLFILKRRWVTTLTMAMLVILPLTAFLRSDSRWSTVSPGFNVAYYDHKETLRKLIPPDAKVIVGADPSHFILLYYLDRKGWTFDEYFKPEYMKKWIAYGASYLCTDCPIDTSNEVNKYLEEKIFEQKTFRVFKLRKH